MMSRERFLAEQANRVRTRLRLTVGGLRDETLAALDLRAVIRRRPWWSVVSAMLGGFVTGAVLGRRPRAAASSAPPTGLMADVMRRVHRTVRTAMDVLAFAGLRGRAATAPPAAAAPSPGDVESGDGAAGS